MTMNRKIAAVLLAATMLTTPAFATSVASSTNTPTAQAATSDKVTIMPDKGVNKHRAHARVSHRHTVRHATHTKPSQAVNHAKKVSKKSLISTSKQNDAKAVAAAPVKAPVKN